MASKKFIGVLMPSQMGLDMETATNVILSSTLYPTKFTVDKESTVPCDAIIESPELAKHIYGATSSETRVRRFDCENDLVFITGVEPAEVRAKALQTKRDKIVANLALAAAAKAAAAGAGGADSKDVKAIGGDVKSLAAAVAVGTATDTKAVATDTKPATPVAAVTVTAGAASAPVSTDTKAAPATATTEPRASENATKPAATAATSDAKAGGGGRDDKKKSKKKKKKPATTTAATNTAGATPSTTLGAPSPPAGGSTTATTPTANLWGSMCLNTFKFVGNADKWTELTGPVLLFAHPRVAKTRGGNHHYRVADAKKLLAQTFDDDVVKSNQQKFAATTWEGKNAAQKERHELRNRGGAGQKLQEALMAKTTGQTVTMAVPAAAAATPASK